MHMVLEAAFSVPIFSIVAGITAPLTTTFVEYFFKSYVWRPSLECVPPCHLQF